MIDVRNNSNHDNQTKLLIIPTEDNKNLAERVTNILREDYQMKFNIEILLPKTKDELDESNRKNHTSPLVIDYFPDKEVQIDIGRNQLKDIVRGKHITIISNMYEPTSNSSINDRLFKILGMINLFNETEILHSTLATPYLPYLRSHSVEKYQQKGFHQFDSLSCMVKLLHDSKLNSMITIDPHSKKVEDIAKGYMMSFRSANPFQSTRSIDPAKLGLFNPEKAKEVISKLRPFHERFAKLKENNPKNLYLVSVDDGTESRVSNFVDRAFPELEDPYIKMVYFNKDRISYGNSNSTFKSFSRINETNIDKEGTYILLDDMFASGGTTDKVARKLKKVGAKKVEAWTTHPVTSQSQVEKASQLKSIDEIVCLDTVNQDDKLNITYLKASANLLAAEIYKEHQSFLSTR